MEEPSAPIGKRRYAQFLEHAEPSNQDTELAVKQPKLDELCARCRVIDLQEIFQRKVQRDLGSFVMDLDSSVEELKASDCPLCQLFGSMSPSDVAKGGWKRTERCHLRVFSANRVFAGLRASNMRETSDTTLLGVVRISASHANTGIEHAMHRLWSCLDETGCLHRVQEIQLQSILGVRLLPVESFNISFVSDCIAYCSANHRKVCNATVASPTESLRVIDCQTRTIVKAPSECQYIAVSYVWGDSGSSTPTTAKSQNAQPTLQNAPKLIDDCIDVTLKLNFRYLWIDRYCIDLSDDAAKHVQIRQMDLIYALAQVTIIAIAGQGPDYGLPGVRGTLRSRQPQLKIGNHFLVSTLPSPKVAIKSSKWATRGWTYQEGLLSKRRLFFTNEQVFYECNGMHCTESLVQPLDKMHIKSKASFSELTPGHVNHDKTPGKRPLEIMIYISEFTRRDLTFPDDALNAMHGIFNAFNSGPIPVHQFLGIPITPPVPNIAHLRAYRPVGRSAEECFVMGLAWSHTSLGHRRKQFPSWTWAGWLGEIVSVSNLPRLSGERFEHIKVSVEENSGGLVRFPTWDNLPEFLSLARGPKMFIHIEAPTLAFSIVYIHRDIVLAKCVGHKGLFTYKMSGDGYYAELQVRADLFGYVKLELDRNIVEIDATTAGLTWKTWVGYTGIFLDKLRSMFLVVYETDSYAERVGISTWGHTLWRQNDTWYSHNPDTRDRVFTMPLSQILTRRTIRLG